MHQRLSHQLFDLDPRIRYVAVNQGGTIVEMEQSPLWPSYNPPRTDEMEELIVNPVVLELARRRGDLDLQGIRYVVCRYGLQYQLIVPYAQGHVSIGIELEADVTAVANKVLARLAATSAAQDADPSGS
jgi:hypothetical protein